MSKRYLVLAALFLLGVSGLAVARSACSESSPNQTGAKTGKAGAPPLATPAGIRWLQGQPSHWRALLLHRD
jgi:hypothetical protein